MTATLRAAFRTKEAMPSIATSPKLRDILPTTDAAGLIIYFLIAHATPSQLQGL